MPATRWRRNCAGSYRLVTHAKFTDDEGMRFRPVYITVERMPEWPGPDRWGVQVIATDSQAEILGFADVAAPTCAEAKTVIEKVLILGFFWEPGVGAWCVRPSEEKGS